MTMTSIRDSLPATADELFPTQTATHAAATYDRDLRAQEHAIVASHLRRAYHKRRRLLPYRAATETVAVDDVSFAVPRGTIFGLLGPNGAGKTTTIKMLSTLLVPSGGTATVDGCDVVRDERQVRRRLGVVLGGDRGLYAKLSAWDNLVLFGNLYGMTAPSIRQRATEMLELVGLNDRRGERVEGYSRGMKQRLHLAKALLHDPPILMLDEPSIGLDPVAAVDLRRAIAALVPAHTVLLTTHDMAEADLLCDDIAIVDHGRIVAQGTPARLKERVGVTRRVVVATAQLLLHMGTNRDADSLRRLLAGVTGVREVAADAGSDGGVEWTLHCDETAAALDGALSALRTRNIAVRGVRVLEPTLEDAFLAIVGRGFE